MLSEIKIVRLSPIYMAHYLIIEMSQSITKHFYISSNRETNDTFIFDQILTIENEIQRLFN